MVPIFRWNKILRLLDIVNYAHPRGVTVEGELGAIVGVEDEIVVAEGEQKLVDVDEALRFMKEIRVDAFAPAIGTSHGLYKGEPQLDFGLFAAVKTISLCPLVIHGGTGLTPDVFQQLVRSGAAKINVSTAIKIAYCGGMEAYLKQGEKPDGAFKNRGSTCKVVETLYWTGTRQVEFAGDEVNHGGISLECLIASYFAFCRLDQAIDALADSIG